METIKEFLVSDIYLDIIKELGVDNFNQDVQSVEVEELKNRLRQRQFFTSRPITLALRGNIRCGVSL